MLKMGYQGVALLIAAVIGIGFAAYQYYSQYNTGQSYESQDRSQNYVYVPPPPETTSDSGSSRRRRRKSEDVCSICQENLQGDLRSLKCKHSFHKDCIEKWFKESKICPICRSAA